MKEVLGALGVFTGSPQQTRLVTPYADGRMVLILLLERVRKLGRSSI
jgi:hypothetical protein